MATRAAQADQAHDGAGWAKDSYGVALRARIAQRNLDELGEWIAAAVPGLDESAAREVVEAVALGRKGLSILHHHLSTRPDALVSGDSDGPVVFLRLMRALVEAGHPAIPLRCIGCGRSGHGRRRHRALLPTTIRRYVDHMLPVLLDWSHTFDSLREITNADVHHHEKYP
jgi:hypothetical protein